MKRLLLIVLLISVSITNCFAQLKLPAVDKSPMDMSYYPNNYPLLRIQDKASEPLLARVIYSRPQKNGRAIFGDLIEYGKLWRLGANEATEIEFYQPVTVGGTKLRKGRYTLYAIPDTGKWTIIFNKETDIWGSFKYDIKKDVLRVDVPVEKQPDSLDVFTMLFDKLSNGINLVIAWDDVKLNLPIAL